MFGVPKDEFLMRVRDALGKTEVSSDPEYLPLKIRRQHQRQKVVTVKARADARRTEILDSLVRVAGLNGWHVYRSGSVEGVVDYVVSLAKKKRVRRVVRSDDKFLKTIPLDERLQRNGANVKVVRKGRDLSRKQLRRDMAQAQLGITGVDYAVAETGTCVLLSRDGMSRAVSLLPTIHVAIVEAGQVYENLDDIFAICRLAFQDNRYDMGSYMSFISGPSRTADIEQTIVVGVHGPKEAHMVLLDSSGMKS